VELARVDGELPDGLRVRPGRVLLLDQRRVQDAVGGAVLDLEELLTLVGGERGDVDEADDVAPRTAALVMIAPPYECPTASTGPGICASALAT
jgi:hypothetical protein